jgi:hypothetical protein
MSTRASAFALSVWEEIERDFRVTFKAKATAKSQRLVDHIVRAARDKGDAAIYEHEIADQVLPYAKTLVGVAYEDAELSRFLCRQVHRALMAWFQGVDDPQLGRARVTIAGISVPARIAVPKT